MIPVWLDVSTDIWTSYYTVPVGWDLHPAPYPWVVNVPGRIVFAFGHLHDHGVHVYAVNETTGRTIFDSYAHYGGSVHHGLVAMDYGTPGLPQAVLQAGQQVRLYSVYNNTHPVPIYDAMGIMILYVAPDGQ